MIRRIIYIFLLSIVILLTVLGIVVYRKINTNNSFTDNELQKENYSFTEEDIKVFNNFYEGGIWNKITLFIEKNGNWDDIPLTKHFREKYNEKDGILGNIQFDKVEYCPYEEGTYPFTRTSYFVITQGKKKTAYIYTMDDVVINENGTRIGLIDDITLSDPIVFIDENGHELDTRLRCTEENWKTILNNFVSQEIETQYTIAVTDTFNELYPDFRDVFLKKVPSQKDYTSVIYSIETQEQSDYNSLTAIYRCFEIKNTKNMRLYKVHFILDDKQYIDDVDIEILE